MAFKLKLQGKSKELYGSDNTMVRKGLVTPAYLMEGPGDKVKKGEPKTQQQVDDEATQIAKENMKLVSTETRKVEGGTEKVENFEGEGESTGFSKDPAERAKQKQWIKDNPELHAKLLAEKKAKDQKITFIPDKDPDEELKPKPDPNQKASVKATNIGTKLTTQEVDKGDQIQGGMQPVEEVYYVTGYKEDGTRGKIKKTRTVYKKVENKKVKTEQQKRDATKDETDDSVVIGSTGDADRIANVVTDQLNQKTVSNMLDPSAIIKGSMMIKNLIGKNK